MANAVHSFGALLDTAGSGNALALSGMPIEEVILSNATASPVNATFVVDGDTVIRAQIAANSSFSVSVDGLRADEVYFTGASTCSVIKQTR